MWFAFASPPLPRVKTKDGEDDAVVVMSVVVFAPPPRAKAMKTAKRQ